jgi:hypothetical protein
MRTRTGIADDGHSDLEQLHTNGGGRKFGAGQGHFVLALHQGVGQHREQYAWPVGE